MPAGDGLRAPPEGGDPEPAVLPSGGRRGTAWLKDGELGKGSFRRSQRLGGAEGALRSGRRMSCVGQVCLSPRAGPGKSPSGGSGRLRLPQWREVGSGDTLFTGCERQQGECGPE